MAIGLSLSNESVQNSYFIASHLLQRCKFATQWEEKRTTLADLVFSWILLATAR
jgi:hypothetical protein